LRAVRDRLAVQHEGARKLTKRGGYYHELDGPIPAVAAPQANLVAVLVRDDPEAVVLELVQPSVAGRHLLGEHRLTWADEPGGCRRCRARGECINMARHFARVAYSETGSRIAGRRRPPLAPA
jgi:hypothetical protein